jgi:hypothetical protein
MLSRVLAIVVLFAYLPHPISAQSRILYIPPTADGFEVYLAAAMSKKNVPVSVSTVVDKADLTLKAS